MILKNVIQPRLSGRVVIPANKRIINTYRLSRWLTFWTLLIPVAAFSQAENLKIGDWKPHFAFNDCFEVIETPTKVIGAAELGLVIYDKGSQSISTLTKVSGLSDYGISAISYLAEHQTVIIGYSNGNIDLITNGQVYNINALKIKRMDGSKRINSFLASGNTIYCSTDFGIMLLNFNKKEVAATWYIGPNASDLQVFELAIVGTELYAATARGLRKTSLTGSNPAFFANWQTISPTVDSYTSVAWFSGQLIAAMGRKGQTNTLQSFAGSMVRAFTTVPSFYNLTISNNHLVVISGNAIRLLDQSLGVVETITSPVVADEPFLPAFRDGVIDSNNNLWVADVTRGLLKRDAGNQFFSLNPVGPASNQSHQLLFAGSNLWAVAGGITSTWNNAHVNAAASVLTIVGWQHLTSSNTPALAGVVDLIGISANPLNPSNIFINSWGHGVFELDQQSGRFFVSNNFNRSEHGLQNIDWAGTSGYVRVGATAFDKNNTLYMTNSGVENGLVAYFPADQTFVRFNYRSLTGVEGLGAMLMPATGDKWMIIGRGPSRGLFVWNDNNTPKNQADDKYRGAIPPSQETDNRNAGQLLMWNEKGEEITRNIFSFAEDQNGDIWIGTDLGIVVQYQPRSIFTRERPVFSRIKIARNDGSGLADYLLDNEVITAIAVDAGNRKWLGTQGSGIFLLSPDGTRTIASYNTLNSPLPSDFISSIAINHETGEVFIGTSNGIVSTRGGATTGRSNFSNIYAFPNPVRPEFKGMITITGLMVGSNVKVTDVAGNLVYETTSVGGQAFWDGTSLWGNQVKPGVYLVFVASEDGSKSGVTKIAIIR